MPQPSLPDEYFIDHNGCLAERTRVGEIDIVTHYDDVPESDVTVVNGLRCTTPLRTVIDLAIQYDEKDLEMVIRDCLDRRLFTPHEAFERVDQPDLRGRPGARRFARILSRITCAR
jgi:hypothetical protein